MHCNNQFLKFQLVVISFLLVLKISAQCINPINDSINNRVEINTLLLNNKLVVCGDSVQFQITVQNKSQTDILSNIYLYPNMPLGINNISSPTPVGMTQVTGTNELVFKINNDITPQQTVTLYFWVKANCDLLNYLKANYPNQSSVLINNKTKLNYTINGICYYLNEPNGSESFNVDYADIEVFLKNSDANIISPVNSKAKRHITIRNSGMGYVKSLKFTIKFDSNTNFLALKKSNSTIVTPTFNGTTYKQYVISNFSEIGNRNNTFDKDEVIELYDSVIYTNCNSSSKSDYIIEWGCTGSVCNYEEQEAIATGYISALNGEPALAGKVLGSILNACNSKTIRFILTNTGKGNGALNDIARNIIINTNITRTYGNATNFRIANRKSNTYVPFDQLGLNPNYGQDYNTFYFDNKINFNFDGQGGFEDLDGDGYYDDLAVGDTLEFAMDYQLVPLNYYDTYKNGYTIYLFSIYFNAYSNCDKYISVYHQPRLSLSSVSNDFSGKYDILDGETASYKLTTNGYLYYTANGHLSYNSNEFIFSSGSKSYFNIYLPQGYTFVSLTANGTNMSYSVNGKNLIVPLKSLYNYNVELKIQRNCAQASANKVDTFRWNVYYMFDSTCNSIQTFSQNKIELENHCGTLPGFHTKEFSVKRSSLGWIMPSGNLYTLKQLETAKKVNPTLAGLRLDRAYPFDTIRLIAKGIITNDNYLYDNANVMVSYYSNINDAFQFVDAYFILNDDISNPIYLSSGEVTFSIKSNKNIIEFKLKKAGLTFSGNSKIDLYANLKVKDFTGKTPGEYLLENFRAEHFGLNALGDTNKCESFGGGNINIYYIRTRTNLNGNTINCSYTGTGFFVYREPIGNNEIFPNEFRPLAAFDTILLRLPSKYKYVKNSIIYNIPYPSNYKKEPVEIDTTLLFTLGDCPVFSYQWAYYATAIISFRLEQVCEVPVNSGQQYSNFSPTGYIAYRDNLYAGINFIKKRENNSYYMFDYNKNLLKTSANQIQDGYSSSVEWPITFQNTLTYGGSGRVNWVAIEPGNSSTILEGALDANNKPLSSVQFYGPTNLAGKKSNMYIQLGSISDNSFLSIKVKASYRNCQEDVKDKLKVYFNQDCSSYIDPTDISTSILTKTTCKFKVKEDSLLLRYKTSNIQWSVNKLNKNPKSLCDTVSYELNLISSKSADMHELGFDIKLPKGVYLYGTGGSFKYPETAAYNNFSFAAGTWAEQYGNTFHIDLKKTGTPLTGGILPGNRSGNESLNEFKFKFIVTTDCQFDPGLPIMFNAHAITNCNDNIYLASQKKIPLSDFPLDSLAAEINVGEFTGCSAPENSINVRVSNLSNQATLYQETLNLLLPSGIEYMTGTSTNGEPVISGDTLKWYIPAGKPLGELVNFTLKTKPSGTITGNRILYQLFTSLSKSVTCASSGTSCPLTATTSYDSLSIRLSVPVLITQIDTVAALCKGEGIQLTPHVSYSKSGYYAGPYSYNWYPASGLSCVNCEKPVAKPATTTWYHLAVTDTKGCTGIDSVIVKVKPSLIQNILAENGTVLHELPCNSGFSNGPLKLSLVEKYDNYTWFKDKNNNTIYDSETDSLISDDSICMADRPGTYYLMVSNATDCSGYGSIIITSIPDPQSSGIFIVTNSNLNGEGSLRAAIESSNALNDGKIHRIQFCQSGAPFNIIMSSSTDALPAITKSVIIDATNLTQPVEINLSKIVTSAFGIQANDCQIKGFYIHGSINSGINAGGTSSAQEISNLTIENNTISDFGFYGIMIGGGNNHIFRRNKIGTNLAGTASMGGSYNGIIIHGFGSLRTLIIGGDNPEDGNIISGCGNDQFEESGAIRIYSDGDDNPQQISIKNNKIGTDITGTVALSNYHGIYCLLSNTVISGNIISGNIKNAINTVGNGWIIENNKIGVSVNNQPLGNGGWGIYSVTGRNSYIGNSNPLLANIIANNTLGGIGLFESEEYYDSPEPVFISIRKNIIYNNPSGIKFSSKEWNGTTIWTNNGKKRPIITTANPLTGFVSGTTDPSSFHPGDSIEIFRSDNGKINALEFLGQTVVQSDGTWQATGLALRPGESNYLIATITDAPGYNNPNLENTSEFSEAFVSENKAEILTTNWFVGNECVTPSTVTLSTYETYDSYKWYFDINKNNTFEEEEQIGIEGSMVISNPGLYKVITLKGAITSDDTITINSVVQPGTYYVTNTNNSGVGSLSQAITDFNASVITEGSIMFCIPGNTPHTINMNSPLGTIGKKIKIDGNTQPLNGSLSFNPRIIINDLSAQGLYINGDGSVVENISFASSGKGITINGSNCRVSSCNISADEPIIINGSYNTILASSVTKNSNNGSDVISVNGSHNIIGNRLLPNTIVSTSGIAKIVHVIATSQNNLISGNIYQVPPTLSDNLVISLENGANGLKQVPVITDALFIESGLNIEGTTQTPGDSIEIYIKEETSLNKNLRFIAVAGTKASEANWQKLLPLIQVVEGQQTLALAIDLTNNTSEFGPQTTMVYAVDTITCEATSNDFKGCSSPVNTITLNVSNLAVNPTLLAQNVNLVLPSGIEAIINELTSPYPTTVKEDTIVWTIPEGKPNGLMFTITLKTQPSGEISSAQLIYELFTSVNKKGACGSCPKTVITASDTAGAYLETSSIIVQLDKVPIACPGASVPLKTNVSYSISGYSGSPYRYSWTPASGLSCTDCQNPVLSASASGWYKVSVTDRRECIGTDSVYIQVVDLLPAEIYAKDGSPVLLEIPCENRYSNAPLKLGTKPSYSEYLWFEDNNGNYRYEPGIDVVLYSDSDYLVNKPGLYNLQIKNQLGCIGYDSIDINSETDPSFSGIFAVTNTNNDGKGSLRQAIVDLNNSIDGGRITFCIPWSDPVNSPEIVISSPLDTILKPAIIDASLKPDGSVDIKGIRVSDASPLYSVKGLIVKSKSTIKYLTYNSPGKAFDLKADNIVIDNCHAIAAFPLIVSGNSSSVTNCILEKVTSDANPAILIEGSNNIIGTNNRIIANSNGVLHLIVVASTGQNNTFTQNSYSCSAGINDVEIIHLEDGSNNNIISPIITRAFLTEEGLEIAGTTQNIYDAIQIYKRETANNISTITYLSTVSTFNSTNSWLMLLSNQDITTESQITALSTDVTKNSSEFGISVNVEQYEINGPNSICLGLSSLFNCNSEGIMAYNWNMGDGSVYTTAEVNHKYTAEGTYNITLELTLADGTKQLEKVINVRPVPTLSIALDVPMVKTDSIVLSPSQDALVTSMFASRNNGTSQTNEASNFYLRILGITIENNSKSYIQFNLASVSIPANAKILRAELNLFGVNHNTATNIGYLARVSGSSWAERSITWSNRPAYSTTGMKTLNRPSTTTQNYTISIIDYVSDWLQTPSSNMGMVLTLPDGVRNQRLSFGSRENSNAALRPTLKIVYSYGNITVCSGDTIRASVSGANTYQWRNDMLVTCPTCANTLIIPYDTTTYRVIGANIYGCTDTSDIIVNAKPSPIADAGSDKGACPDLPALLSANQGTNYRYYWTPSIGLECTTCRTTLADPPVSTEYTLKVTNIYDCSSSDRVRVIIPNPANYDCPTHALTINPLNETFWCSKLGEYRTDNGTADNINPTCWTGGVNNNKWLKFTAFSTSVNINIQVGSMRGSLQHPAIAIYDSELNLLKCAYYTSSSDPNNLIVSFDRMVVGQTYYITIDNGRNNLPGSVSLCMEFHNGRIYYARRNATWFNRNTWSYEESGASAAQEYPSQPDDIVFINDRNVSVDRFRTATAGIVHVTVGTNQTLRDRIVVNQGARLDVRKKICIYKKR